jgi:hypothetical protein
VPPPVVSLVAGVSAVGGGGGGGARAAPPPPSRGLPPLCHLVAALEHEKEPGEVQCCVVVVMSGKAQAQALLVRTNNFICLWKKKRGCEEGTFTLGLQATAVAAAGGGPFHAVAATKVGTTPILQLLDVEKETLQKTALAHKKDSNVSCVAAQRDTARWATGSDDNEVRIWDGLKLAKTIPVAGSVHALAWFPDGRLAVACYSEDKSFFIIDTATGAERTLPLDNHEVDGDTVAALSYAVAVLEGPGGPANHLLACSLTSLPPPSPLKHLLSASLTLRPPQTTARRRCQRCLHLFVRRAGRRLRAPAQAGWPPRRRERPRTPFLSALCERWRRQRGARVGRKRAHLRGGAAWAQGHGHVHRSPALARCARGPLC